MNAHRPVRAAALPAPPPSETELERVRSDPRVARLGKILALGDALLLTGLRIRYSIEGGGVTLADETLETFSCAGARCVSEGGEAVTAADLSGSTADLEVRLSEVGLGERGVFDTTGYLGAFGAKRQP